MFLKLLSVSRMGIEYFFNINICIYISIDNKEKPGYGDQKLKFSSD